MQPRKELTNCAEGGKRWSESHYDRYLEPLQEACAEETTLLNQIPNLQDWLNPENIKLLHQLNLVNNSIGESDLYLKRKFESKHTRSFQLFKTEVGC